MMERDIFHEPRLSNSEQIAEVSFNQKREGNVIIFFSMWKGDIIVQTNVFFLTVGLKDELCFLLIC